jgi:serine/threonine protein kinase
MQIARFEILGILGTGAFGVVALARDRADASSDPVALKVLNRLADADTEMMIRLREEAKVLAWLRHPNIVWAHRLLEKDGRPVVVMDYIQGASVIEQIMHLRGPLPPGVALEMARRSAMALEAAHEWPGPSGEPMRIVHRDIKPANLLLSTEGEVKVVDFGIASGSFEEPAGQLVGTRGYVAPERRNGGADTPAVDVYALGVTLFEMMTGKLMNQAMAADKHDASVRMMLAFLKPAGVDVPRVRDLIGQMCRYDPAERPPISEIPAALEGLLPDTADLRGHAERCVTPICEDRRKKMAETTDGWPDVAFLEHPGPVKDAAVPTNGPVRGLALRPETEVDVEPMLAIIGPKPWWSFRKVEPDAVIHGLLALRGTRDPRVIARAQELTEDPHPGIVDAAWDVLISAA